MDLFKGLLRSKVLYMPGQYVSRKAYMKGHHLIHFLIWVSDVYGVVRRKGREKTGGGLIPTFYL